MVPTRTRHAERVDVRTPIVQTLCNDCGDHDIHHTRAAAFEAMEWHELEHATVAGSRVYVWQQFCTDNGWVNYRAPVWGATVN